ncbi:HpcH/HpaI aldolase/citrate lyase family protein [Burkholderia pseudomallei]|uniref:HpcH/HpaI aldolase/citrate lyase family protein n=1 Tax=Burkholderia pseudomallei TaxID=28450 RepID=UPI0006A64E6F|nr:CoA ester lyase [Burkholderia pseudomallei]
MKTSNEPVWRSLLYVPAHVPRFVAKAAGCDADALILDLEDSVPPEWKAPARDGLADTVAGLAAVGHEVLVRANGPLEPLVADLRAALAAGVHGIVLPKVRGASHIEAIDELLDALEAEHGIAAGRTRIVAIIETPGAFQAMERIARASPRIAAMMLGGGDFALHCGAEARADVLRVPKQLLVIAARAARVQPLGLVGGLDEIRDLDTFERLARESADLGYAGATCIHPAQVEALNRAFRPSDAAVRAAREIVAAYDDARANGRGALRIGDRMVDAPGVAHARNVLARADAIARRPRRCAAA